MENLKELFYFLYVIHYNALTTFYYFIITNLAFVVYAISALYVFNKRNVIVEKETIRPLRRNMSSSPYRPTQKNFGGLKDDIVLMSLSKERVKLVLLYIFISILVVCSFIFATRVVLYMATFMWVIGALSVFLLKGDRKEMAELIENYSLGYCISLLIIKVMISIVVGTPASEWSRSLGVALPSSAAGTITGYLPMMFMILVVGIPFAYLRIVGQRYTIAKDNQDVTQRRSEVMRTGNQDMLHYHQEDMYKTNRY